MLFVVNLALSICGYIFRCMKGTYFHRMPFSKLHRKRKTRESRQKYRQESLMLCPCSLCLNRVQLRESDVNKHIERFGLADESVSSEGN